MNTCAFTSARYWKSSASQHHDFSPNLLSRHGLLHPIHRDSHLCHCLNPDNHVSALLLQLTANDLQSQFDQVVVLSYSHQYP